MSVAYVDGAFSHGYAPTVIPSPLPATGWATIEYDAILQSDSGMVIPAPIRLPIIGGRLCDVDGTPGPVEMQATDDLALFQDGALAKVTVQLDGSTPVMFRTALPTGQTVQLHTVAPGGPDGGQTVFVAGVTPSGDAGLTQTFEDPGSQFRAALDNTYVEQADVTDSGSAFRATLDSAYVEQAEVGTVVETPSGAQAKADAAQVAAQNYAGTLAYGTDLQATDAAVAGFVDDPLSATRQVVLHRDEAAGALVWDSTGSLQRPAAGPDYDRFVAYDRATGRTATCLDQSGNGAWAWVPTVTPVGFDARHFGAVGDTIERPSGGAITAGSRTLTDGSFTAADVGKAVLVEGAGPGGATLQTTISAYLGNATVELADAASTTVTNSRYVFGTDNTAALQTMLDTADSIDGGQRGRTFCYLPEGVYLTGQLTWRLQSLVGVGEGQSVLRGRPSTDILRCDSSVANATREVSVLRDLTFVIDDSEDASAGYNRNGVGNAGIAAEYPDGAAPVFPLRPANVSSWENVEFRGASGAARNQSAGLYAQQSVNLSRFRNVFFYRLVYGWWDDYPRTNLSSVEFYSDHNHFDSLYFNSCTHSMRRVNSGQDALTNLVIHGGLTGLTLMGQQSTTRGRCHGTSLRRAFIENVDTPWDLSGASDCTFADVSLSGAVGPVVIASRESRFANLFIDSDSMPSFSVTGSLNDAEVSLLNGTDYGGRSAISDTGIGNRIKVSKWWGSSGSVSRLPEWVSRDVRVLHSNDSTSLLHGHVDPMFVSGDDLVIHPHSITPTNAVQGTDFDWVQDNDAHFGVALRIFGAGGWNAYGNRVNGISAFRAGRFLPLGRVRVYYCAKLATAGQQTISLWTESEVYLSGRIITLGTDYTVDYFDADLSNLTLDTGLLFQANNLSSGVGPLDVAWIGFRPWHADLQVTGDTIINGGIVLKSPNGTAYRLTVADGGTLTTVQV